MFWRMVRGALLRQMRKMLLVAVTIALGASLATAMLGVSMGVGEKVNRELKTYGANITIVPRDVSFISDLYESDDATTLDRSLLSEEEVANVKTIFWANNIVDFAPYLEVSVQLRGDPSQTATLCGSWFNHSVPLITGEQVTSNMQRLRSWWTVQGAWLEDDDTQGVMVGSSLAARLGLAIGDTVALEASTDDGSLTTASFTVRSVFSAGSDEDEQFFVTLLAAQQLSGHTGKVSSIEVSALTTPDNDLARKAAQNPGSLSQQEYETWYCTAYVSAICYQIDEVIPEGIARPVRQVAESEGSILEKTQLLMLLITILSLVGSALGISNLVMASVMERAREIGLIKALGAYDGAILRLVLTEIGITGIVGGVVGYFLGVGFAQIIGQTVFSSSIAIEPLVAPTVTVLVLGVVLVGSIPAIRLLLGYRPAEVLHGR